MELEKIIDLGFLEAPVAMHQNYSTDLPFPQVKTTKRGQEQRGKNKKKPPRHVQKTKARRQYFALPGFMQSLRPRYLISSTQHDSPAQNQLEFGINQKHPIAITCD